MDLHPEGMASVPVAGVRDMTAPRDARSLAGWFGRVSAPQHFHDQQSHTPLSIVAVGLGAVAAMFLLPMLRRRIGLDEWLMLAIGLALLFLAWRCWRFARAPYITLRRNDLVIGQFFRPSRLAYADITAAAVEFTMMRPKKNHPPIPVHTFHLALRNGRYAKRLLPFGSDARMLAAFTERTGIHPDDIRGAEGARAWKERQRLSHIRSPITNG